jgi:hypothetical protein
LACKDRALASLVSTGWSTRHDAAGSAREKKKSDWRRGKSSDQPNPHVAFSSRPLASPTPAAISRASLPHGAAGSFSGSSSTTVTGVLFFHITAASAAATTTCSLLRAASPDRALQPSAIDLILAVGTRYRYLPLAPSHPISARDLVLPSHLLFFLTQAAAEVAWKMSGHNLDKPSRMLAYVRTEEPPRGGEGQQGAMS